MLFLNEFLAVLDNDTLIGLTDALSCKVIDGLIAVSFLLHRDSVDRRCLTTIVHCEAEALCRSSSTYGSESGTRAADACLAVALYNTFLALIKTLPTGTVVLTYVPTKLKPSASWVGVASFTSTSLKE